VFRNIRFTGCTHEYAIYEWCIVDEDESKPWDERWEKCSPGYASRRKHPTRKSPVLPWSPRHGPGDENANEPRRATRHGLAAILLCLCVLLALCGAAARRSKPHLLPPGTERSDRFQAWQGEEPKGEGVQHTAIDVGAEGLGPSPADTQGKTAAPSGEVDVDRVGPMSPTLSSGGTLMSHNYPPVSRANTSSFASAENSVPDDSTYEPSAQTEGIVDLRPEAGTAETATRPSTSRRMRPPRSAARRTEAVDGAEPENHPQVPGLTQAERDASSSGAASTSG